MAYIGNARTLLIVGTNVRDDLVPGYADPLQTTGPFDKTSFQLSQEVPGGHELNVSVFRQRYIIEELIEDTTSVDIVTDSTSLKITCSNSSIASALSIVKDGENIIIDGSSNTNNNNSFKVLDVVYDGASIEIILEKLGGETSTTGETLSLSLGKIGFWEVLEPEIDYVISGINSQYNRLIELTEAPQLNDKVYVVHKGEATYNFVPSPYSVGPDQLQENLRNFVTDRFTASSDDTFDLSQDAVSSSSIEVYVDGVWREGRDSGETNSDSDWELSSDGTQIVFDAPITSGRVIIKHLGFSTVSRRSALSPGQAGSVADGSITAPKIANGAVISDKLGVGSVTASKLASNSVSGTKILLNNNESLRGKKSDTTETNLIKVNSDDSTHISSVGKIVAKVDDVEKINITSTEIEPSSTDIISLGTSSKKFKDLHLSGSASTGSLTVNGNITVTGTVDGGDISDMKTELQDLRDEIALMHPVGSISLWVSNTLPDATNWKICDGSAISRTTYATLFALIGTTFGSGDGSTTFNIPDLRGRSAIGKKSTSSIGSSDGLTEVNRNHSHTHSGAPHTHDLSNHTHTVKKHHHAMGTGADLNITSSGQHNTTIDISHSHGSSSVSISESGGHEHGTFNLTATGGSHSHNVDIIARGASPTTNSNNTILSSYVSASSASQGIYNPGVSSTAHTHTVGGTIGSSTDGKHTHTGTASGQTLGTTNKTDTGGQHIHNASSISGKIGEVTDGVDGNADQDSGTPSNNNTGSASYSGNSGSTTIPHLTLNYIIKVS